MLLRPLALLCAAAILASLFLPRLTTHFGESLVPWATTGSLNSDQIQDLARNAAPGDFVFLASFALAANFLLMALIGQESKSLAFLTGGAAVGLVARAILSASNRVDFAGLPVSSGDLSEMFVQASELPGPGAWAWIGGALLVPGLLNPGRRKA